MTITDMDLRIVRAVLKETDGVDLAGIHNDQLHRRVARFCDAHRLDRIPELIHQLRNQPQIRTEFKISLSMRPSALFHDAGAWTILESDILPALGSHLKIWSAGCGDGADAYSLAIAAIRAGSPAMVLGSDGDRSLIESADGHFTGDRLRETPPEILGRFFSPADDGSVDVHPTVRRMVRFERRDLLGDPPPLGRFDLVACREVVVYFSIEAKHEVFHKLAERLRPGGVLFAGRAERIVRAEDYKLEVIAPQFYRRTE